MTTFIVMESFIVEEEHKKWSKILLLLLIKWHIHRYLDNNRIEDITRNMFAKLTQLEVL